MLWKSKKFFKELFKSYNILRKGGIILYPTDTVWGIGCDVMNFKAIQKIYFIKKRSVQKPMILLVNCLKMLTRIVKVPKKAWEIIKKTSSQPVTIIYKNPIPLFSYLTSKDNTIAIRITNDFFCQELIKYMNAPLISTSSNFSGESTPLSYYQINNNILSLVDYIVNLRQKDKLLYKSSSIIKFNIDGSYNILRK